MESESCPENTFSTSFLLFTVFLFHEHYMCACSEWRYFNYNPRTIRFVSETGRPHGIEAHNEITLSQFSAAMVPKCDMEVILAHRILW